MKYKLKQIILTIISILVVLSLSGCGKEQPKEPISPIEEPRKPISYDICPISDAYLSALGGISATEGQSTEDINLFTVAVKDAKIWDLMTIQDEQLMCFKDCLLDVESIKASNKEMTIRISQSTDYAFPHKLSTYQMKYLDNDDYVSAAVDYFDSIEWLATDITEYANFGEQYSETYTLDSVINSIEKVLKARKTLIDSRIKYLASAGIDLSAYNDRYTYSQGNLSEEEFYGELFMYPRWMRVDDDTILTKSNILFDITPEYHIAKLAFIFNNFDYSHSPHYRVGQNIWEDIEYLGNSEFKCLFESFDENGNPIYEESFGNIDINNEIITLNTDSVEGGLIQTYKKG